MIFIEELEIMRMLFSVTGTRPACTTTPDTHPPSLSRKVLQLYGFSFSIFILMYPPPAQASAAPFTCRSLTIGGPKFPTENKMFCTFNVMA